MQTITITVLCPHCTSGKIVKNGRTSNGNQNYWCQSCKKQFQAIYQYTGANSVIKKKVLLLLCRNAGIRDITVCCNISQQCVLKTLKKHGKQTVVPQKKEYRSVQIDEVWSFVGQKKNKYWLLYAYAPETKEVLAFVCGSRSRTTVRKLYKHLSGLTIGSYDTDHWKSFKTVFPEDRHRVGKEYTKHIEVVNTSIRARNRRFVRRTTCFSKSKEYHEYSLSLYFSYRNMHHTL